MKKCLFAVLLILYFVAGCKTKTQYVPIEVVKTEYINQYLRDSIHYYDSVFVKEKGDTLWVEKYKYIYRDRIKTDTVLRIDSVQVPYPVTEYKEINRLNSFQSFQIWCGRILLALLLGWFGFKLIKRYL